jgi:FlaA1/EpsC-like NDP-sugar epimerase
MTIPEAVELVLQSAGIASDGEVLILDMGDEVRIDDVARRLIERSGKRVEIVYTGLRPGEKLSEDLLAVGEEDRRPNHPLITQACVPPITYADVDSPNLTSVQTMRDAATN